MSRLSLLEFNAFGITRVGRHEVTTTITAVQPGGKSVNRTLTNQDVEIDGFAEGEFSSFIFGVQIYPEKKSYFAIREFGSGDREIAAADIPQVKTQLEKCAEIIRKSVKF